MVACSEDVTTSRSDGDKQNITFSVTYDDAISVQIQNASTRAVAPWTLKQISQPATMAQVVAVETDFPSEEPLCLTIIEEPFIRRTHTNTYTRGALLNSSDAAALSFGVTEYPTGGTVIGNAKWENSHPSYEGNISAGEELFKAIQKWESDAYTGTQYDFYAYAPWQDGGSGQGIALSENRQAITYDPTGVPANNQPDLMTALKATSAYVSAVPLTFHHRLCAVQIKTASTWNTDYEISGIEFQNIYYSGSFNIDSDKDAAWTNYNQNETTPGNKGNYTVTGFVSGVLTANTVVAGDADTWLMMVPQTLSRAKLSITLRHKTSGETYVLTAPINNTSWRAGYTTTYVISPESITSMIVSYPKETRRWKKSPSGYEDGPVTSYSAGQEFGLFVVDKAGNIVVSNATATAHTTGTDPVLDLPSDVYSSKLYKYFLMYPKLSDTDLKNVIGATYDTKFKAGEGVNTAATADLFFEDVTSGWSVQEDQSSPANFMKSDLQIGMFSGEIFSMQHKMGLVELQMTDKAVPLTKTLTYSTEGSGSPTSTVFSSPNNAGSVSPSTDFTGNKPLTVDSRHYYVVKSTSLSANSEVSFTCNANQKDFWSAKSSGTDVGYGMYKAITVQSDRDCLNFIALFDCVKTVQTVTLPWYGVYKLECWGAQGGDLDRTVNSTGNGYGPNPYGGKGAYVCGQISLSRGTTFRVYVGEEGGHNNTSSELTFNGGGHGANQGSNDGAGSRGGGATDIRTVIHSEANGWGGDASLDSRIIVAAGGGGCTTYGTVVYDDASNPSSFGHGDGSGGAAGGLYGYEGLTTYKLSKETAFINHTYTDAQGGSQSSGGAGWIWGGEGNPIANGVSGDKGYGGSTTSSREGGGGSGLYGGGSGGVIGSMVSSGAGGSSFISGHPGCSTITGYSFSSTTMIDGKGLSWTTAGQTTGGDAVQMPTTSGGLEALNTGHSGNGYAKITSQ